MDDPFKHATLGAGVFYKDPMAALTWLERAFGFQRSILVTDPAGNLVHSEMRFADAYLVIDSEWSSDIASPASVGGKNTQSVYLKLEQGLDEHCECARQAGAEILQEPADQPYGDRTYRARDPEGHIWTFSQTVRHVSREAMEAVSGWKIDGWHQD
ncbi:putative glyoxalase superfamily protein PhnB [Mesorhizobium soli]|uniref:VOC family protein n=1 Tax=Pseudaminobacter soli (ex Li et al. 2025) TaxID=1295366 RepID=UPI002475F8DA|nr:VOC family protein [Mesorhizobium soli]MDH6232750.1 putative glyoxalase superfamily protein PhnB [Mesorhizobium soli]